MDDKFYATIFGDLFDSAKSTKYERVEDFVTGLVCFMCEIDKDFRESFISIIKNKVEVNWDLNNCDITSQFSIKHRNEKQHFKYDLIIEKNNKRIIIENKIDSIHNQFKKYKKHENESRKYLLIIPKDYDDKNMREIGSEDILYWENLMIALNNDLKNTKGVKKKLLRSFFNYLYDYAGLYYDSEHKVPKKFKEEIEKYVKRYEYTKKNFLRYNIVLPVGTHGKNSVKPTFSVDIDDFYLQEVYICLYGETPLKDGFSKHEEMILNDEDFEDYIQILHWGKQSPKIFEFSCELKKGSNYWTMMEKFVENFYGKGKVLDEFKKFKEKIDYLMEGDEEYFKKNLLAFYSCYKQEELNKKRKWNRTKDKIRQ